MAVIDPKDLDFSNPADLKRIVDDLVTPENWEEDFSDRDAASSPGYSYVDGTEHVVRILEFIVDLPFEEMKQQLTNFIKERRNFIEYANTHGPELIP